MRKPLILIVEDDAISGKYLQKSLLVHGYETPLLAFSAEELEQRLAESKPDLILMDIRLGSGVDGIEAARSMVSIHDIPVIYLTAYTDPDTVRRAKGTDPYGFLVKPVNISELHIAVEFALYRHQMEKKLKSSEEKFRVFFEESADAQVLIDGNRYDDCNIAAVHLMGAAGKGDILGKAPFELSPEFQSGGMASAARMESIIATAHECGSLSFEWIHLRFDGSEVPVEITLTVVPVGGRMMLHGVIRDTTARQTAREALRRSEEQYRMLVEAMNDGLVQEDESGLITFINERFRDMLGYRRDEIIGSEVTRFVVDEDRTRFIRKIRGKERGVKEDPEIALESRTGEKIYAIVSSQALFDDRHRHAGTVMVFTDISERKRLERQLLEITIGEQQRIGRDLHDDLGQILAGTGFLCESLARKLANKKLPEAEDARSIFTLLRNAREHTRMLASGMSPLQIEAGELSAALERLIMSVQGVYPVSCSLVSDPELRVDDGTVETQFHYIAQESINNALTHGRATEITVRLEKKDGGIRLLVADNGVGIPDDAEFKRGMGLRIMQYRAGAIGASFSIYRNGTKGTTVSCVWKPPGGEKSLDSAPGGLG